MTAPQACERCGSQKELDRLGFDTRTLCENCAREWGKWFKKNIGFDVPRRTEKERAEFSRRWDLQFNNFIKSIDKSKEHVVFV